MGVLAAGGGERRSVPETVLLIAKVDTTPGTYGIGYAVGYAGTGCSSATCLAVGCSGGG